ncbi:MAG TPA: amino acid adenylation domain-containing protein, partial [Candidatus Methylacidiphilales bacterium]
MKRPGDTKRVYLSGSLPMLLPEGIFLLGARFEEQAALFPQAVALSMEGASLTYAALNARANQVAAYLRWLGVGPESLVGIHLERSFDLIVGILAILKAGGAYLPLDLVCPEDRLKFMVEDSSAQVVLTESRLASRFAHCRGNIVHLDEVDLTGCSPANVEQAGLRPENLAYVIYTSGSTGTPKGVLVTHENVARLFTATEPWFRFRASDVWTLFHSSAFDFSVWEIFGALLYGGRLVVVPYAVSRSAEEFHQLLVNEKVTVLNQTPSAFRQLVQADLKGPKAEVALRYIIFGGEALEFQSLAPWFERYGDQMPKCINMYGITETTVHVTYRPITREDVEAGSGSNIGVPIPDLQVYVVNEQGARVGVNETGEMLVGGKGVARGYLNRPELTRERFVPNPFEPKLSPIVYRTGDSARLLPNGDLEYLGRIDQQVKIRGYRIELNEINSVLMQHPEVRESTVVARVENGESQLVAYLVARRDKPPGVETLRRQLATKLPDDMVPAIYVFLDSFPLTLNGKLDRNKLPAPGRDRPALAVEYVPPQDDLEEELAEIWKRLLKLDRVGVGDNFIDLGGDSLLVMKMMVEVEKLVSRPVGVQAMLEGGTIRELAATIRHPVTAEPLPLMLWMQEGAERKLPLFFAHGDYVFGGLYCRRLIRRLGPDQPFIALAPHGTFGGEMPERFEQIATSYITWIRSVQPTGPYQLGGFCNGAIAMYEVAQQLIR